ncbi:MAG: ABC transporter ATP-binding protein, partial [Thermoprotei archaeon]
MNAPTGRTSKADGEEAAAGGEPFLELRDLVSGYYGRRVIDGISFKLEEPGVYVVLGANGAGKTTLFRTIAGILKPIQGEVKVCGEPSTSRSAKRRLEYVSHMEGIPEGMRVGEGLEFYAKMNGTTPQGLEGVVELLNLGELYSKTFSSLSQGQRKRVSVARIFLRPAEVYLLDEPTANLDPKVAREVRQLVLGFASEKVVLYSSHNLLEAREIGSTVIAIKEGRLYAFKKISELETKGYRVAVRT